jgi:hypothetical protein
MHKTIEVIGGGRRGRSSAASLYDAGFCFLCILFSVAFLAACPPHARAASPETIGASALQALPNDAQYNKVLNFRPGNGDTVTINPPQFSWLYDPDPRYDGSDYTDTEVKMFIFQTSSDSSFAPSSLITNVKTPLNFYNTLAPFTPGSTIYWRVGYIHSAASTPFTWTKARSFTVASNAASWDRSMLADPDPTQPLPAYLSARAAHPHLLFSSSTAASLDAYLEASGGTNWTQATTSAASTILLSWWPGQYPGCSDTVACGSGSEATWAQDIGNAAFVLYMASSSNIAPNKTLAANILASNPGAALAALAEYYVAQNGPGQDVIANSGMNQITKALSFGYDWLYGAMTPAQRAIVLNALNLRANCIVDGWDWFYNGAAAPFNSWQECDLTGRYPGGQEVLGSYSAFKTGSSHAVDNFNVSMIAALSAYGDSPQLRRIFDFASTICWAWCLPSAPTERRTKAGHTPPEAFLILMRAMPYITPSWRRYPSRRRI